MTTHTIIFVSKYVEYLAGSRGFSLGKLQEISTAKKVLLSASVMQKTVLCLYGILTCLNLHSH